MIIKIIFVLLFGTAGAYVGILLKKRLDRKKIYFADALAFCENFKHNLTYNQNKLKEFVDEFNFSSNEYKRDVDNFLKNFDVDFTLSNVLSQEEKNEIKKLFSSIGKVDVQTQLTLIEERKNALKIICDKLKEKSEKDGKLFVKLGLLIGLCAGVLLV
jgi:hypothetical protein